MWTLYIMRDYSHNVYKETEQVLRSSYNSRCKATAGSNIVAMFLYKPNGELSDHCFLRT